MKLFFLLSRIPYPLEKGDKVRAYYQLRELSKRHEVFLCCLYSGEVDQKALAHLKTIVAHVEIVRLSPWRQWIQLCFGPFVDLPFQALYFKQRPAAKKIHAWIRDFRPDQIVCQMVRTSEYVKSIFNCPKTLDYQDALSVGYERRINTVPFWQKPFYREESIRLKRYEQLVFDYFDFHWIISEQDRLHINHSLREKIRVVPNGVDTNFFTPDSSPKKYDLVFAGNMGYAPNVECVKRIVYEIWPKILVLRPMTTLLIAGAEPTPEVILLAEKNANITVSGWMDDIRDAYRSSSVLFAPMTIGSGLQNKILEAMSCQLPCITTPLVLGGIGAFENHPLLICQSNENFANQVVELLNQESLYKELAVESRAFVVQHFGWNHTLDGWLEDVQIKKAAV
jgi:polysaccharide biosynthesis protein PslH